MCERCHDSAAIRVGLLAAILLAIVGLRDASAQERPSGTTDAELVRSLKGFQSGHQYEFARLQRRFITQYRVLGNTDRCESTSQRTDTAARSRSGTLRWKAIKPIRIFQVSLAEVQQTIGDGRGSCFSPDGPPPAKAFQSDQPPSGAAIAPRYWRAQRPRSTECSTTNASA